MMKKGFRTLWMTLAGAVLYPAVVLAGDINSAEQGVVDAISVSQEYNGAYYKVTDAYVAKVIEYLGRDDIDMTQTEADNYIAQFYANIAVGVNAGYMEKIGDVEQTAGSEDDQDAGTDENNDSAVEEEPTGGGDQTIGSTSDGTLEYTVLPIDEETMYVSDVDTLDVHAEAYKDSDILGTLAKGDAVTVIGAASTGWAQIQYLEDVGYVSAAYLRTDGYVASQEEVIEEEVQEPEEPPKDYSDAEPIAKSLNLKAIAVAIVVFFTIAIGGIIIYHKNKRKSKTRRR